MRAFLAALWADMYLDHALYRENESSLIVALAVTQLSTIFHRASCGQKGQALYHRTPRGDILHNKEIIMRTSRSLGASRQSRLARISGPIIALATI